MQGPAPTVNCSRSATRPRASSPPAGRAVRGVEEAEAGTVHRQHPRRPRGPAARAAARGPSSPGSAARRAPPRNVGDGPPRFPPERPDPARLGRRRSCPAPPRAEEPHRAAVRRPGAARRGGRPGAVAASRRARAAPLPGQRELVPAARTVLVVLDRAPTDRDVAALRRLPPTLPSRRRHARKVVLTVVFDGPDLAEVAERTGRDGAALVAASPPSSSPSPSAASRPASAT